MQHVLAGVMDQKSINNTIGEAQTGIKKPKTRKKSHTKNENKKSGYKEVQMNGIVKYEGQEMTRSVSLNPQRQIF